MPITSLTHNGGFPYTALHLKQVLISKSFAYKNKIVRNKIMESVELKLRGITGRFPIVYTKKIVEILGEPELSIEVEAGQLGEDVPRLLESLGYHVAAKREMDGWVQLKAVKKKK